MPLGNVWAFPSRVLTYDQTLGAMRFLASRIAEDYRTCGLAGHPIDVTHKLEPEFFLAGNDFTALHRWPEPVPKLAVLVVASPFDAALHDAFGQAARAEMLTAPTARSFWNTTSATTLGAEFDGLLLHDFVATEPKAQNAALSPRRRSRPDHPGGREATGRRRAAGTPRRVDPARRIDAPEDPTQRATTSAGTSSGLRAGERGSPKKRRSSAAATTGSGTRWTQRSGCQNVEYLLEFLRQLKVRAPAGYDRGASTSSSRRRATASRRTRRTRCTAPRGSSRSSSDESLLDLESLKLAMEMGYTGVAFKACKGQTQSLLLAAAAQKYGLFRCVQDLTCVGASLIHSAGLATAASRSTRRRCGTRGATTCSGHRRRTIRLDGGAATSST